MTWKQPNEPLPENFYAGDRIAIIVVERAHACAPLRPRVVMLTALESGWTPDDEVYSGYGPQDGVAWAAERDLTTDAVAVYAGAV